MKTNREKMEQVRTPVKLYYHQRDEWTDKCDNDYMIIDSAAWEQFISDIDLFKTIMEVDKVEVDLFDRTTVTSEYIGKVLVDTGIMIIVLSNAFFIPNLQLNLISCSVLEKHGITTVISNSIYILIHRKQKILSWKDSSGE